MPSTPPPLSLALIEARRFLLRSLRLEAPSPDLPSALDHLGYVQIDPLNICGRMHDLILRNRVEGYSEGALMNFLHGKTESLPASKRLAFEHHLPGADILVAFPLEAWPHLQGAMKERAKRQSAWSGRLTAEEKKLAPRIFEKLAEQGPVGPESFPSVRKSTQTWLNATLAKSTLQKLFFHGELLIAQRVGNRRLYDLPHRVLPECSLRQPASSTAEVTRWLARLKLKQRRLTTLTRTEVAAIADQIQAIRIPDFPLLYCLLEDVELFANAEPTALQNASRLLAPLDPLIYDRRLTKRLWNFDYIWEVYTPAAKRVRGYYALPILSKEKLIGHVEPRANRKLGKLEILSQAYSQTHSITQSTRQLARFLGLQ